MRTDPKRWPWSALVHTPTDRAVRNAGAAVAILPPPEAGDMRLGPLDAFHHPNQTLVSARRAPTARQAPRLHQARWLTSDPGGSSGALTPGWRCLVTCGKPPTTWLLTTSSLRSLEPGRPWPPRMSPSTWSTTSRPCWFRYPTAPIGRPAADQHHPGRPGLCRHRCPDLTPDRDGGCGRRCWMAPSAWASRPHSPKGRRRAADAVHLAGHIGR